MIELINLTTGYGESKPLLKNFNYTFENKVYGILGESGCGKTTLLRTIAGLMKPLNGVVVVDNKKISKASENNIYMMHQNYTSFDWLTCLDNILIPLKIKMSVSSDDMSRAYQILDNVGLTGKGNVYPRQLSGGQRQRLALARTLFTNPEIVLMDEPLSALDEVTRIKMQDLILKQHKKLNNTIILVTHSKEEAERLCDVIIKL